VDGDPVGERHGEGGDEIGPAGHRHAVEQPFGRAPDERLGGVDDLGRERGDHHPADGRVLRWVELPEDAVLEGHLDTLGLHARGVGQRLGVPQCLAAFGVPGDVVHPARDGRHRPLPAQLLQQRPGALGLPRIERIEPTRHRRAA
jgi:hypothetical protein